MNHQLKLSTFTTIMLLMISCLTCFGQIDTTKVPFVSYWAKGDSYNFEVTKIKQKWKNGQSVKKDTSSYVVNFLVIDSTEKTYKIKWSYKTDLSKFNIPPELKEAFTKYKTTEVIYKTDEVGVFLEIENWEEIAKMMKSLFADVIDMLVEQDKDGMMDKKTLEKMMKPLANAYNSQEGIEYLLFKEIQYFHFPFGLAYSTTKPLLYEEQLPNMFGGKPIRGDTKVYLEKVDFENAFCTLIQEMELNPEDTKAILQTLFKKMKVADKELKKAMKTAVFNIKDYNSYQYYFYPGVPYKIETSRESLVDMGKESNKTIEMLIIELIN